jgi:hypothetical protein
MHIPLFHPSRKGSPGQAVPTSSRLFRIAVKTSIKAGTNTVNFYKKLWAHH